MANTSVNEGLINKESVETYTTKSFQNEGVAGSTPADRLTEAYPGAITPAVMELNIPISEKIAHTKVKSVATGEGMPSDSGSLQALPAGTKSAGNIGSNNANHS